MSNGKNKRNIQDQRSVMVQQTVQIERINTQLHKHTIRDKTIQSQRTKEVAVRYRINQEIKFLYNKKRHINNQLYQAHLASANEWNNQWNITEQSSEENLKYEIEQHYNFNLKLDNLIHKERPNITPIKLKTSFTIAQSTSPLSNSTQRKRPYWTKECNSALNNH